MDRLAWLEWRHKGIGSSDAPAIHGKSPYKTALELWREKMGPVQPEKEMNFAMQKGVRLEPLMRLRFSSIMAKHLGAVDFVVENLVMAEFDFMRASLDGVIDHPVIGRIGIECKYAGASVLHTLANNGNDLRAVREDYWIQMQHQMLVGNLQMSYFVAVSDEYVDKSGNLIKDPYHFRVDRDEEFMKEHLKASIKFWNPKRAPDATDEDVAEITKGASVARRFIRLSKKKKEVEKQLDELKKTLISYAKHPKNICHGVSITKVERAGSVDYSKIPELQNVDLEKFRKPSTEYWKVGGE